LMIEQKSAKEEITYGIKTSIAISYHLNYHITVLSKISFRLRQSG
jgi:hypothetical protein